MRFAPFLLLAALLAAFFVAACGGGDDDGGATAESTTAPATNDGGNGGDAGSIAIDFSGQVSGSFTLGGMSCSFFPNAEGEGDDQYYVSITGTVDGKQYTIDINTQPGGDFPPQVSLGGSTTFSRWDNRDDSGSTTDSGTVLISNTGGSLQFDIHPVSTDAGAATENVTINGDWICPDNMYSS